MRRHDKRSNSLFKLGAKEVGIHWKFRPFDISSISQFKPVKISYRKEVKKAKIQVRTERRKEVVIKRRERKVFSCEIGSNSVMSLGKSEMDGDDLVHEYLRRYQEDKE